MSNMQKLDAGESILFSQQLEYVISRLFEVEYPEHMARRLIPLNTEAHAADEFIVYYQYDRVGMAKLISDYADDLPRVDVKGQKFTSPIESLGVAFGYSVNEIRAAQKTGRSLPQDKANAAREADEARLDAIAAFGDALTGLPGFLNNSNVPTGTVANPGAGTEWAVKTAEEILFDMQQIVSNVRTTTKTVESPDTMILPDSRYEQIAQTKMPDIAETVMSFFLRTNPHIVRIVPWHRLETAGAGGTARMLVYRRSPDKLELHIPQDYEVFEPQARNLEFVVNTHMRVGGVTIYRPLSMRYEDGI